MSFPTEVFDQLFPHLTLTNDLFPSKIDNFNDKALCIYVLDYGERVVFQKNSGRNRQLITLKANRKIPLACPVYYFEAHVDDLGSGTVAIGVVPRGFPQKGIIGKESGYGFTLDDGKKHSDSNHPVDGGAICTSNDTVGVGVNFISRSIFFTKNGESLGEQFKGFKGDELFPALGINSPGANISVNFGQKPFIYNINSYVNVRIF